MGTKTSGVNSSDVKWRILHAFHVVLFWRCSLEDPLLRHNHVGYDIRQTTRGHCSWQIVAQSTGSRWRAPSGLDLWTRVATWTRQDLLENASPHSWFLLFWVLASPCYYLFMTIKKYLCLWLFLILNYYDCILWTSLDLGRRFYFGLTQKSVCHVTLWVKMAVLVHTYLQSGKLCYQGRGSHWRGDWRTDQDLRYGTGELGRFWPTSSTRFL